jgi:signal transduction histidine kinase
LIVHLAQGEPQVAAVAPRLPLDIGELMADTLPPDSFDFSTDATGLVDWADPPVARLLVGLRLVGGGPLCDQATALALHRRGMVRGGRVDLPGPELVAGLWRLDATPRFDSGTGVFRGYVGRLRRPLSSASEPRTGGTGDRMRQVLHELRTPVNAIQGFAEIIQQQLFGSAPNAYRALAGAIGVDAARLLAGFDELDRLARLENAALELSNEGCNFRLVVETTLRRLEGVTRPRSAHLRLLTSGELFSVGLGEADGALLAWRLLASLAGALGAGEVVELSLRGDERGIELESELPVSLSGEEDLFAAAARSEAAVITAGMFGTGFTLRLARAEAEAAGGSLVLRGETLVLSLPGLTHAAPDHSQGEGGTTSAAG